MSIEKRRGGGKVRNMGNIYIRGLGRGKKTNTRNDNNKRGKEGIESWNKEIY